MTRYLPVAIEDVITEAALQHIVFHLSCPCGTELHAETSDGLVSLAEEHARDAHGRSISKPKVLAAMQQKSQPDRDNDPASLPVPTVTDEQEPAEESFDTRVGGTEYSSARESGVGEPGGTTSAEDVKLLVGDAAAVIAGLLARQSANPQLAASASFVRRHLQNSSLTTSSTETPVAEEILKLASEATPHLRRLLLGARARMKPDATIATEGTTRPARQPQSSVDDQVQPNQLQTTASEESVGEVLSSAADIRREQDELHQLERLLAEIERENRLNTVRTELQDVTVLSQLATAVHNGRMSVIRNIRA